MLNKWADDLHMAALNLGELLPAFTVAFAQTRDRAVNSGNHNVAAFYGELAAFCADTRDHYARTITDFENDHLDDMVPCTAVQIEE